jgi:G3E family GTPase
MDADKIPVTVLTGFLGAGKTTLLNRILSENHGKRIAVIENEFGEIGIDQALVIDADEEIFEMNNGCICCTVRGDLIRILGNLMKRRDKFDHILVETTGMADPGPVAQTFFVDDEMQEKFRLDGIVTLVDARHVLLHLSDSDECKEQIAFADVVVLNKTDLVGEAELEALETRIRSMNALARIRRAAYADVPVDTVLDVGGFDLDRALEVKPTFLEPEYPFEWGGVFHLDEGTCDIRLSGGNDPAMKLVVRPVEGPGEPPIAVLEEAMRFFSERTEDVSPGTELSSAPRCWNLSLEPSDGEKSFSLRIPRTGHYGLFTEHLPEELGLRVVSRGQSLEPSFAREYAAGHTHDETVGSVGLRLEGPLDEAKLNRWLGELLREQGADIFRMKGILDVAGRDTRWVFQGVHMLVDGREDKPWGNRPRVNELVLIGRRLDRAALTKGFASCLA